VKNAQVAAVVFGVVAAAGRVAVAIANADAIINPLSTV
jgi:hypothetical protein